MKKIILILSVSFVAAISLFAYLIFSPNEALKQTELNISGGNSAASIGRALKSKGLIKSYWAFRLYAKATGADGKLVSGIHQIQAKSSIKEIISQLETKENIARDRKVTIIEGWKLADIEDYLQKENVASAEDFAAAADIGNWRDKYDFLQDNKITSLEGYLFPDTYQIFLDATPADLIKKMLDNFDHKITAQMRSDLAADKRTLNDAVILASIIEREALYDEDRAMIADIFLKRIDAGIGLQSDATVNYITGKKTTRPSAKDLQINSPYNTYKYKGLTPGPIGNPGLASIKAAIYPKSNDYYYFLTDSSGHAIFAKTYQQHLQNIQKHLE